MPVTREETGDLHKDQELTIFENSTTDRDQETHREDCHQVSPDAKPSQLIQIFNNTFDGPSKSRNADLRYSKTHEDVLRSNEPPLNQLQAKVKWQLDLITSEIFNEPKQKKKGRPKYTLALKYFPEKKGTEIKSKYEGPDKNMKRQLMI